MGVKVVFKTVVETVVVTVALVPLYNPQLRWISDMVTLARRRATKAMLALTTIGYFELYPLADPINAPARDTDSLHYVTIKFS
jgi:hypothetical protein